jgi:uncharacterized membrane protein YfhO
VDGSEVPVSIVNGALMGLEVPEGSHQVELSFTDPGFHSGLQATLAGVLVLVLLGLVSRRGQDAPQAQP